MKEYDILYKETYSKWYKKNAESIEEAEDKLIEDLSNGKENGPDECCNSVLISYSSNMDERLNKRKVLIASGMSGDCFLFITDASENALVEWCKNYNKELENGENHFLEPLKKKYYVNLLFDSETSCDRDDIGIIGYDEQYDLDDYMEE